VIADVLAGVDDVALADRADGHAVLEDGELRVRLRLHQLHGPADGVVGRDADHGLVHQVGRAHDLALRLLEGVDDAAQRREPRVDVAALDPRDQRLGDVGGVGELALGQVQRGPSLAEVLWRRQFHTA